MKHIFKKLMPVFFIIITPFAYSEFDPESMNINELVTSYPPLTIEFQGQRGTLFIEDKNKSVYFLTNQGKDLDYISTLLFDEIISVFLYQYSDPTRAAIYILGRKKYDTKELIGFNYKYIILDLEFDQHNILRIIDYTPPLSWISLKCFYGIDHGKKKDCKYKDELSFKAYLDKDE